MHSACHVLFTLLFWFLAAAFSLYYLLYSCYSGRWKRRLPLHLALLLFCLVPQILCKTKTIGSWYQISEEHLTFDPFALPLWTVAAITGIIVAVQIPLLLHDRRLRKEQITRLSVKESIEQLPVALCFSAEGGMPILANRRLSALSFSLQNRALQNADRFWNDLPPNPVHAEDGSVWTFRRDTIMLEDGHVTQIAGFPITDLDNLRKELQKKNDALLQNNRRLRQYSREVEALTREQEIFAAKSRIHNEIGGMLLTTQHALLHAEALPTEALLAGWSHLVSILEQQKVPDTPAENRFTQFCQAANSIDVRIVLQGFLPADPQIQKLIVAVGKQALANAVRHANATTLTIRIDDHSDGFTVCYTNDGEPPTGEVVPGGGLSEAKTLTERTGGWMEISSAPQFELKIFIPRYGGEHT